MSTGNTGTVSPHFNFTLPGYDDDTDVDELNTNFNIIDTSLYNAVQDIATNASAISTLRDSVLPKLNNAYASGVGYITGADILSVWLPLRDCNKYSTFNITPLNARGSNGMIFNDGSLPTNIAIANRSSIGCIINLTQRNPDASNRYKVCTVEFYITAS